MKQGGEGEGEEGKAYTRVDEVVRVVVVTDGARLGLVELGVLDFFELALGFFFGWRWGALGCWFWGGGPGGRRALMGVVDGRSD